MSHEYPYGERTVNLMTRVFAYILVRSPSVCRPHFMRYLTLSYTFFFFRPIGVFCHESVSKQRHEKQYLTLSYFESMRHCRSAPGLLHRKSVSHSPFTYIKTVSSTQTTIPFLPTLSTTTTTLTSEKDMLICQQNSVVVNNNNNDHTDNSIFLTYSQLAATMTAIMNDEFKIHYY